MHNLFRALDTNLKQDRHEFKRRPVAPALAAKPWLAGYVSSEVQFADFAYAELLVGLEACLYGARRGLLTDQKLLLLDIPSNAA